jgi:hypothetical protein
MGEAEGTRRQAELEVLALRKALDTAQAEIERLERTVVELERAELRTQSELATALAELEEARRADPEEADRLRRELDAALARASRYRGALVSVLESRSWKLTRPLRMLRRSTRPEEKILEEIDRAE